MASSIRSSHLRSSRAPRPIRSSRTQVQSYHEDSSSEDRGEELDSDDEEARRLSLSLRPRDSHRMRVSYREESSDEDFEDDPDAIAPTETPTQSELPYPETTSRTTPSRPPRRRTVRTRSQTQRSQRPPHKKRLELGRPLNKRRKVEEDFMPFVGSGVIPPWHTLPYHILFDIFLYASYPLVDEWSGTQHSSVRWLVNVSLLCRAFHEPALAALYYCPPLIPDAKSHGLLSLASKPQESLSTNYVNKIRELNVDVEQLLLYKSGPTLGYFDLAKLVEHTPQLKRLRLFHVEDHTTGIPIYQKNYSRWTYPDTLFTAIASSSIRLRSWDWNSRFMDPEQLLPLMMAKHLEPAFSGLREVKLLHMFEKIEAEGDNDEEEVVLATALKELPELRRLEFFECSLLNEHLFPMLPSCLTSLTLHNCVNVTTLNLGAFLSTHGQNLRELNLLHLRHMSLSFTVGLAQSCPRLERFKVDISMHDQSSYHDVEPHFRHLFGRTEVPTWPATLQDIEMHQLSKWDDNTAEVFFTSLIEAAPELRNLRRLWISAILKIGWRDRASFREKWIGRLEKVFLRRSSPPDPNLRSIPRPSQKVNPGPPDVSADHVAGQLDVPGSGPSTPSKRKSARLAQRKFSEIEDDAEFSPGRGHTDGEEEEKSLPCQGMCDVVTIRIDNQRPTETQFNEQDFLDDELSGDEDWNGRDMDVGDGGHAW
ncbi:hypothetical protein BDV59DRAFT_185376 [Aspergillus ambiguus]|uniref:uncharacterized protein n=1 Tax=Aspergillus ambiguus TaxID=176160 RepID=UPI003CCCC7D2